MNGSNFTAALSDFAASMQRMLSSTQQLLEMGQPPSDATAPSSFNPMGVSCHPSPPLDKTQVLGSTMASSPNQPTVHQLPPLSVATAGASSQQGALENPKVSASPHFDRSHVAVLQQSFVPKDISTSSQGPAAQIATNRGKQDGFLRRYQPFRRSGTHLNPKTFFCYRCGDRGHRASSCRNALVCFTCGRLGHRAANCRSIPPLPPQIQAVVRPQMADPVPAPLIRVFPNRENQKLQDTLLNCLIFYDSYGLGASYVKSQLARIFRDITKPWVVKSMPGRKLLVEPPDLDWRQKVKAKGEIWLGDVSFLIETYDPYRHDGGFDPIPVWLLIDGIPPRLRTDYEFKRIAEELGGIVIDVDPRAKDDLETVRMCLGVPNKKKIVSSRDMSFLDEFGRHRFYSLSISIEPPLVPSSEMTKGKLYWQEVAKVKAQGSGSFLVPPAGSKSTPPRVSPPIGSDAILMDKGQTSSNRFACLATIEDQGNNQNDPPKEWDKWDEKSAGSKSDTVSLDVLVTNSAVPTSETDAVMVPKVPVQFVQAVQTVPTSVPMADVRPTKTVAAVGPTETVNAVETTATVAAVVIPEPTRHSTRQRGGQVPQVVNHRGRGGRGGRRGRGARQPPSGPGIVSFLDDFPFVEFTDDELIKLFETAGFKLGTCYDGKLIVIHYLRGLHKEIGRAHV